MSITSKARSNAKRKKKLKEIDRKKLKIDFNRITQPESEFEILENPFKDFNIEERKEFLDKINKTSCKEISELLTYFDRIFKEIDPIQLVSVISNYAMSSGIRYDGIVETESILGIDQAELELLQALSLTLPTEELGTSPIYPKIINDTIDKLRELSKAFALSRLNPQLVDLQGNEKAIAYIQEQTRSNTQYVRNWGFYSQIVNISKEMYSHFDQLLLDKMGFTITAAIDLFTTLVSEINNRKMKTRDLIEDLKSIKKPYDIILRYFRSMQQGVKEVDEYFSQDNNANLSVTKVLQLVFAHIQFRSFEDYLIDAENLSRSININIETIFIILDYFSLKFGDLSSSERHFIFLDNPVWGKPVISTGDEYYCPAPQIFFSFILDTLDDLIESLNKDALHRRRAKFLEEKISEIVKRRFPESHIVAGLKWELNGIKYETDLIAIIDSHMLIIEAKSHKVTRIALRGAPQRIKRHIEDIIIAPSIQSSRLEKKIMNLKLSQPLDDPLIKTLPIDINSINKIIRLSVSLEDFATLQSNWNLFEETGWIPKGYQNCPSICLADFETLFDYLEHPVHIIHYLERRYELAKHFKISGDELDFLGLYNKNLLNIDEMMTTPQVDIDITGMSKMIDDYYLLKENGIPCEKPQPEISKLFKSIFTKLEQRSTPQWTEIGVLLNRFSPDTQHKLEKSLHRLEKEVRMHWQEEGHLNAVVFKPSSISECSLAIVLFKDENRTMYRDFIENAASKGLDEQYIKHCLVIAQNIDDKSIPYHFIGLFDGADS